ncbi:TIGR03016 family PEP-CTERM system-associated outer membrane protein, partial [Methylocaldum sp. 14B]
MPSIRKIGQGIAVLPFLFPLAPAFAVDWLVTPNLTARGIYSDNINLSGSGQRSSSSAGQNGDDAFVTELSPGVSVRRRGRNLFNLDYRMQNLFYAGTDTDPRINNQLQMNSTTELWDNSVFIDSTSTIGQYNNSTTGRFAFDNVSQTGNTSDYRTFRISPYWKPHLGGYAEGTARVTYSNIGGGNFDSNIFEQRIDLRSGNWFDSLAWRANFYNQENTRDNGVGGASATGDVKYRNYNGELRYRLSKEFSPFIQAGRFENDFLGQTNISGARNGGYWTAGLAWTPSAKLAVQGGWGSNNHFISVAWEPSKRTTFQIIYRDSDIGGAYGGGGFGGLGYGG